MTVIKIMDYVEVIVNDEDAHKVLGYKWYYLNWKFYRLDKDNNRIWMHRSIMNAEKDDKVFFVNRYRNMDLRKCNLKLIKPKRKQEESDDVTTEGGAACLR